MNRNILISIVGLLLMTLAAPSIAATYYVAPYGNDDDPGTLNKPWRNINKATTILAPGDTLLIRGGIYYEKVIPKTSGEPNNPITYEAYQGETVVIDAHLPDTNQPENHCILIQQWRNLSHFVFRGLTLRNASTVGFGAHYSSDLLLEQLVCIQNGDPNDPHQMGIYLTLTSDSTIRLCEVRENGKSGIVLLCCDGITVDQNNVLYNGQYCTEHFGSMGIVVKGPGPGPASGLNCKSTNCRITNNVVDHLGRTGIWVNQAENILVEGNECFYNSRAGIQIEDLCKNIIVRQNACHHNTCYPYAQGEQGIGIGGTVNALVAENMCYGNDFGIHVGDTERIIVRHNLLFQNNADVDEEKSNGGFKIKTLCDVEGGVGHYPSDLVLAHNTVYANGRPSSKWGGVVLGDCWCTDPNSSTDCWTGPLNLFVNNIVANSVGAWDFRVMEPCGYRHLSNYNNFYNDREGDSNIYIDWMGTYLDPNTLTWEEYRQASGWDNDSITSNPEFLGPELGDLSLAPLSPCIDAGTHLTSIVSIVGSNQFVVEDARYFTDGFGVIEGDLIQVGDPGMIYRITDVDYEPNMITVEGQIDNVPIGATVSYPYYGMAPDMGAIESPCSSPEQKWLPKMVRTYGEKECEVIESVCMAETDCRINYIPGQIPNSCVGSCDPAKECRFISEDSNTDGADDTFYCQCWASDYLPIGDLDDDNDVDLFDLSLLAINWLVDCSQTPDNPACISP